MQVPLRALLEAETYSIQQKFPILDTSGKFIAGHTSAGPGGKAQNKATGEGCPQVHLQLSFVAKTMTTSGKTRANAARLPWNLLRLDEGTYKVRARAAELGAMPVLLYEIAHGNSQGRCNAAGALAEVCAYSEAIRCHAIECGAVSTLLCLLMTYRPEARESSRAALALFHLMLHPSPSTHAALRSGAVARKLLLMIHNKEHPLDGPEGARSRRIHAGLCIAAMATDGDSRELLVECGAVLLLTAWLQESQSWKDQGEIEVAGLAFYSLSQSVTGAQLMKWNSLDSLLCVFEAGGKKASSSRSTSCAAPALINICLGQMRMVKE